MAQDIDTDPSDIYVGQFPDHRAFPEMSISSPNASSRLSDKDVIIMRTIFAVITIPYIPLIIMSNSLILFSIIYYPPFWKKSYNILLMSLSIADLIMGAVAIPMYALAYIPSTSHLVLTTGGKFVCLFWFASINVAGGGGLWTLFLMSFDRFLAVQCAFWYQEHVTAKLKRQVVTGLWVYLVFLGLLPFLGYNNYDYDLEPAIKRCNYYVVLPKSYVVWASFFTVWFSICGSAFLYIYIMPKALQQVEQSRARLATMTEQQIKEIQERMSTVKLSFALMIMFIVLWMPYMLIGPLKYIDVLSEKQTEIIKICAQIFNFTNSVINALIYAIAKKENRKIYLAMLKCPPWNWPYMLKNYDRVQAAKETMASAAEELSKARESENVGDDAEAAEAASRLSTPV